MAEAYRGLRIRRKRVHSAKCSCCCSDDELASGRKEEGEGNNKIQTAAKKRHKRKAYDAEVEDRNNNKVYDDEGRSQNVNAEPHKNSMTVEHCASADGSSNVTSQPALKNKKAKTSKQEHKESEKKQAENLEELSKNQPKASTDRRSTRIAKNIQNNATKPNPCSNQNNTSSKDTYDGRAESNELNSKNEVKAKNAPEKSAAPTKKKNSEVEKTTNTNREKVQSKRWSKKKRLGDKKVVQDTSDSGQINSCGKKNVKSRKQIPMMLVNEQEPHYFESAQQSSNSRSKTKTSSLRNGQETSASPTRSLSQDEQGKLHSKKSSPALDDNSKTKITVFDHLFKELRKCPGHSKATVGRATAFLLGINVEHLASIVMQNNESNRNTGCNNVEEALLAKHNSSTEEEFAEKNRDNWTEPGESDMLLPGGQHGIDHSSVVQLQQENRSSSRAEKMNLSQAAEALVSIKSNPVSRQDTNDSGSNATDESTKGEENLLQFTGLTPTSQLVEKAPCFMQSTALQVLAPNDNVFSGTPMSPLPNLGLKQPQLFPQMPLPSLMSTLPQFAMTPNKFVSLGQLFTQANCNRLLSVSTGSGANTSAPSTVTANASTMSIPTLLFGSNPPLLGFPPIPTSSTGVTPTKTFVTQSNTVPCSQPLPLKGMEEVVGNVGASNPSVLWNVKPSPVVYLASPQTLGGVPRNLVPAVNQNSQVPLAGSECDSSQGGLASVHHYIETSEKVPRVAPGATPLPSVQRPILPREHVTGATQALPSSAALKTGGLVSRDVSGPGGGSGPGSSGMLQHVNMTSLCPLTQSTCPISVTTSRTSSTASLTAKQVVKRFVHERTRSAELRREGSLGNLGCLDDVQHFPKIERSENVPSVSNTGVQQGSSPRNSDFNLQQAATTLLSIAVPEGSEMTDRDDSPDEPEEEVVYTSKGVFRVGDVDVDPHYNNIGREGYTCGKCGKIFTSLSYLARHIKRVCPDMSCRKWKCNRCDKAFRHPFGLQQHIYTHTGERPHKCIECPKAFYSSNDLRRHSRIHSGERPYRCKHCQKTFATTISLKTHTYIHTGEKPHKCPHCPKTFATSSKLGRHIVTHSEQRPFSCGQCPKAFNRSGDLRRHSLHVHETREKPSEGDEYVPVPTGAGLDMHQAMHVETKPSAACVARSVVRS